MNGRLIIDLPTVLSASIITEWVSVKDRVRLDSAHCQVSVREEFLQLTQSPELSVKSWVQDHKSQANRTLVTWAMSREVFVEKLSVERESDPDLYNTYSQKFASRVFALRLNCLKSASLAHSVAACHNLLVLIFHNCELSASFRDVFVCCERLREFYYMSRRYSTNPDPSEPPLTSVHLKTIVCNNLRYLELGECDVDLVAAFLRMAVAVEVVVLTTKDNHLNGIPESMSSTASTLSLNGITLDAGLANFTPLGEQIVNICFMACYVTESAISALFRFPNLRALDFTGAIFETINYLSVLAGSCGDKLTELLLYCCDPTLPLVTVQKALPSFTRLESFSLRIADVSTTVWNMSSFSRFAQLQIYYTGSRVDELIRQLTEHCSANIRELSLCMSNLAAEQLDMLLYTCTKLCVLNVVNIINSKQLSYTDKDKERWKSLRPGLTVGDDFDYRLNVLKKYECSDAWKEQIEATL